MDLIFNSNLVVSLIFRFSAPVMISFYLKIRDNHLLYSLLIKFKSEELYKLKFFYYKVYEILRNLNQN